MPNDADVGERIRRSAAPGEITLLLRRLSRGENSVISGVIAALYGDLKRIAEFRMRRERLDHTLEPAALVNELFLAFARNPSIHWQSRTHFLAAASQEMRRLLLDYARAHNAIKRGGGVEKAEVPASSGQTDSETFLIVHQLLQQLACEDARVASVVEMRCFGGLTHKEISEVLGIDQRTAKRDWHYGRAWLESQLRKEPKRGRRGTQTS